MPEREAGTVEPAAAAEPAALTGTPALAGMRIVVTGAAQGIGASTLRAYVAAGADVAALDVNAEGGAAATRKANAAGPGTAHLARLSGAELEALRARHRQRVALGGQLGDPDTDLAPVMVFLAGPGSRFITGQIIAVNGGLEEVR